MSGSRRTWQETTSPRRLHNYPIASKSSIAPIFLATVRKGSDRPISIGYGR